MNEPLVFFGTGPVAAKSLELLSKNFQIETVVTKPKPEHHKGDFPVLTVAEQLGLPVETVTNKKDLDNLVAKKTLSSKLGVLIDFGIIVSQQVIDYFPLGIVNSHFSLLPEWRGADPITFSILSGQERTGVSLMLLVEAMDEGPILATGMQEIAPGITTPELTQQLINLSDELLQTTLAGYASGEYKAIDQFLIAQQIPNYPSEPTYSRRLTKEDSILNFNKPAEQLEREIRAFIDWPKSRTAIGDKEVVITKAHVVDGEGEPGKIWKDGKQFGFYTTSGILAIDSLKPAGKQEMPAAAFLAGYQI